MNLGAQHRMYFPVEMVLMVKALVTFEGVGQILKPGLDVAAVSQEHANEIFRKQFNPRQLSQQLLRGSPEMLEVVSKSPTLILFEGLRLLEQATRRPENPFRGLRGTLFGGFGIGPARSSPEPTAPAHLGRLFLLARGRVHRGR